MAAAADIDTKELELCIKGLLISRPTVAKANILLRECEEELGKRFPLRQLGFSTFVDYLKSIPTVVQLEPTTAYNPDVYPVASKASRHIDQLVSKQRVPTSRKRGIARRGSYSSRPTGAPPRRRTSRPFSGTIPSTVRSNQGIDIRDLERDLRRNYDERDLTRNGIHDFSDVLSHAEGMVEWGDTKVYPKLASGFNNTDQSCKVNSIPAGFEDELDDFDTDYEFYNGDEQDSEEELSNKVIQLLSQSLKDKEDSSSLRLRETEGNVYSSREETLNQNAQIPEDDSNISRGMINNFRKILIKNLDGIWASELQKLYFEEFHVTLDFLDLGYTSAIALVSSLPSVFSFKRVESHDWKLYDARYITQASLDAQENRGNNLVSEHVRYIPQTIIEKIKKLLEDNPNGFRSTDLLAKYQETFRKPLDLDVLGFNTLDEFLPILKNDITIKKVLNYYLLLPKHKIVSLDALEPPRPDERLKVPAEALCVPIPEDVVRLGEEIPMQELPKLQEDPNKPLMELQVRVAEVISPVLFYMTLDSTHEDLESMMDDLHKYYEWEGSAFQIPLPHIATNLYCAAKYCDGYWHRAKITRMRNDGRAEIEFIDYGTPVTLKTSELRYLSKEFATLPVQAICAKLAGLKPLSGQTRFSKEVCETFLSLVAGKRLYAHVFGVESKMGRNTQEKMQLELILYDVDNRVEEIVLNDYLVENGMASPIITQKQDNTPEVELSVDNLQPAIDLTSLQASCSATSLSMSDFPYIQENGTTSKMENGLSSVLGNGLTSHPGNETTLSASSNSKEEKKPIRPPPGFEAIFPESDLDISTLLPSASHTHPTVGESRKSNFMTAEQEQNVFINNIYLMNSKELYPKLMLQEQYLPQTVYQPNPSNMPFVGTPLFKQSQQNLSRKTLPYGSFLPPQPQAYNPPPNVYRQQAYHTTPAIPNNYFPSVPIPVSSNFVFGNPSVSGNFLVMNNSVSIPYYPIYPQTSHNVVSNVSSKVQNYRGDFTLNPQSANTRVSPVQVRHTPSPSLNAGMVQSYGGDFVMNPPSVNHRVSPEQVRHTPSPSLNAGMVQSCGGDFVMNPPSVNNRVSPVQVRHTPSPSLNAGKVQNYSGDFSSNSPFVNTDQSRFSHIQARQPPSPSPNATLTPAPSSIGVPVVPATPSSAPSPGTAYTPVTVPEWPPKNLPVFSTSSFPETKIVFSSHSVPAAITKSQLSEATQIRRPSTPLTPGSTEVVNICEHSRPNSAASYSCNTTSQNQISLCDNFKINKSPEPDANFSNNSQANTIPSDNAASNFQSEHDGSKTNSGSFLNERMDSQPDIDVSAIILPAVRESPQTSPSPEKLYSAISSPIHFVVSTTLAKEESSDDYASASEYIEEAKQQVVDLTVPESSELFDESNRDIPDSWENLDLDETPSRAENFPINVNQQLELVTESNNSVKSNIPDVDNLANSPLKSEISPLIQPPVNWKDMFDPDTNNRTESLNNNNEVKENSLNIMKFDVKKIPVQKLEIQGKFFHLINVNNVPAVLPQEFFKQFGCGINPTVAVKVIEAQHDKFYNISNADHPDVIDELNKVAEFCGGVNKKALIRLNKASVINLSEIPQCLAALKAPNQPLLDDLKKIINEFELF